MSRGKCKNEALEKTLVEFDIFVNKLVKLFQVNNEKFLKELEDLSKKLDKIKDPEDIGAL